MGWKGMNMTIEDPLDQHGKILRSKGAYEEVFENLRKLENNISSILKDFIRRTNENQPGSLARETWEWGCHDLRKAEKLVHDTILKFDKIVIVEPQK